MQTVNVLAGVFDWFGDHQAFAGTMFVVSIVAGVGSLLAANYFLTTIPPDYFISERQPLKHWGSERPAVRWSILIAKNLLGGLLILAGLIMFFTPGQGILTLLLGLILIDAPGKRHVERKIVERPGVLKVVNKLRARANKPPLVFS